MIMISVMIVVTMGSADGSYDGSDDDTVMLMAVMIVDDSDEGSQC